MLSCHKIFIFSFMLFLSLTTTSFQDPTSNDSLVASIPDEVGSDIEFVDRTHLSYTDHDPIVINHNSDFLLEGFTGYGNSTHPYILEGVQITAPYYDCAVSIEDTNASYVIANCSFIATPSSLTTGVSLVNASNGLIENCTFEETYYGMIASSSENITVRNCTFDSHDNLGFWVNDVNNALVLHNTFESGLIGLAVQEANASVIGNEFSCALSDLDLVYAQNCTVYQNTFQSGGIRFYGDSISQCIQNITDNTVGGKPIQYVYNQTGLVLDGDYGQVILVNCANCVVKDQEYDSLGIGVQILFSDFITIENVNTTAAGQGIVLRYSQNVTITSSNFNMSWYDGIYLEHASNTTIENSHSNYNEDGISILESINVNMTGNEFSYNIENGIYSESPSMVIVDNTFEMNGISTIDCDIWDNSILSENTINNTIEDVLLIDGVNCTITDNTLYKASFSLDVNTDSKLKHIISGNTINGNPVIYQYNETGLVYNSLSIGQLILIKCNNTRISNLDFANTSIPMILVDCIGCDIESINVNETKTGAIIIDCASLTISDVILETSLPTSSGTLGIDLVSYSTSIENLNATGFSTALRIRYSIEGNISSCNFIDDSTGISINSCANFTVSETYFGDNEDAFWTEQCFNCTLLDSTFRSTSDRALYMNSEFPSWNIINNTIVDSEVGIYIERSFKDNFTGNVIDTYHEGGILVTYTENSSFINNTLTQGFENGFILSGVWDSQFIGNEIYWNNDTGIYIEFAEDCIFVNNSLGGNRDNAYDDGTSNQWDDGIAFGNMWSDHKGTGTYSVPGTAGSVDNYPRQIPDDDPPVISSPPDATYDIMYEYAKVTWHVSDIALDSYVIYRNGTDVWESEVYDWDITYSVTGTPAGVYNYTIMVNDTRGNQAFDTVMITINAADGFFYILNNTDFVTHGFPGSGTLEDPYRIENLTISGDATCIYIQDTSAHFVIRNCFLLSKTTIAGYGIWLTNVTNGIIENCTFYLKQTAIYADESPLNEYYNNTVTYGELGIWLDYSDNSTLEGNTISNIAPPTVQGPLIDTYGGVRMYYSPNSTVIENTIVNCTNFGMIFYHSGDTLITNNTLEGCGIMDYYISGLTMEGNTANGKPVLHLVSQSDVTLDPDDYGQIILENCTDIRIQNGAIYEASLGIQLNVVSNSTLTNVTLGDHGYAGACAFGVSNVTIENSTIYGCFLAIGSDFSFLNVTNSTLACNYIGMMSRFGEADVIDCKIFANAMIGLSIGGTGSEVYGNLIAWNYLTNALSSFSPFGDPQYDDGMSEGNTWSDYSGSGYYYVDGGGTDHYPSLITDSTAPTIDSPNDDSYETGSTVTIDWHPQDQYPGWFEIYVNGSFHMNGTWFSGTASFTPSFTRAGTYNVTIIARDAALNQITDTVMIMVLDNSPPFWDEVPQDQTIEYTEQLNYRVYASDLDAVSYYTVNDTTCFSISSTGLLTNSTSLDPGTYALMITAFDFSNNNVSAVIHIIVTDTQAPTISSPADVHYNEGTGGHSVTWDVSDDYPLNYSVLLNGTSERTKEWSSTSITISIDGLPAGVHNITIIIMDSSGNSASDTVMVTVLSSGSTTSIPSTTTTTTPATGNPPFPWQFDTMTVVVMTLGILIIAIVVVIRIRRRETTFTP